MCAFENDFIIQELYRRLDNAHFTGSGSNRSLNFRCPICGDSKRFKNKRRGYIYQKDGGIWFCCFNCSTNLSYRNFLKEVFPDLFNRFNLQKIKNDKNQKNHNTHATNENEKVIDGLIPLKMLPQVHTGRLYFSDRKIPSSKLQFAYWGSNLTQDLLCPFQEGVVFSTSKDLYVARNIDKRSTYRYYIKKNADDVIFGEEFIDKSGPVLVTEGLIDSLFLPNCVPALSSNLENVGRRYKKSILVWDNEPRNSEIVSKMHKALKNGHRVVVWPNDLKFKDINDMVIAGLDPLQIIAKNNLQGIKGLMRLNLWKKTCV